jgi:hypothetical protein
MLIGALLLVRAGTAPVASAAPNVETAPRAVVGSLLMLRHPDMPTDSPLSSLSPVSSLSPTAAEEEALADVDGREDTLLATKGEASPSQLVHAKATVVAPSASAPARTAPVPAPPSCTPPFVIQPRTGRKIWKLECL